MKLLFHLIPFVLAFGSFSQKMNYHVDLTSCIKDQLSVTLNTAYKGSPFAFAKFGIGLREK
jgi:hypothetical protein